MYKIVEEFIEKLDSIVEKNDEGFFERTCREKCVNARTEALDYLNRIFKKFRWSEEFVISFAVYCNFFFLQGLHKVLGYELDLDKLYDDNVMNLEEREYLDYIYCGIRSQNIGYFDKAVNMNLFDFDLPKYYIYLLNFLELCLREEEDYESAEGRENIYEWYCNMENAKNDIEGELSEYIEPFELSMKEEAIIDSDYGIFLPRIIISNYTRKLALAASSDLEKMSDLSGQNIEVFQDLLDGLCNLINNSKDDILNYIRFGNEFIKRSIYAEEYGDYGIFLGKEELWIEEAPICRKNFLNLPVIVSEKQYRNIALAKQVKLNYEKDELITKNEKLVEDYSHSVENIMKPALIVRVADYLREDINNRELYNKIMHIYFNEVITQNECRLLKMVHNVSVTKGAIRENISKAKIYDDTNGILFNELVYKAINQVALQLSEDSKKSRFMFILDKMNQVGIDSKILEEKLWESSKKKTAVYDILKEKIDFCINISDELKKVSLNEEELGTSFLYTRIVELITNAFTYGKYDKYGQFSLHIYLDSRDDLNKYIVLEMINSIGDIDFSSGRSGNGLNATEAMLERINYANSERDYFVIAGEKEKGKFTTRMYIDADLYL